MKLLTNVTNMVNISKSHLPIVVPTQVNTQIWIIYFLFWEKNDIKNFELDTNS